MPVFSRNSCAIWPFRPSTARFMVLPTSQACRATPTAKRSCGSDCRACVRSPETMNAPPGAQTALLWAFADRRQRQSRAPAGGAGSWWCVNPVLACHGRTVLPRRARVSSPWGWARIAFLIEMCKLNQVEPHAWMKSTLEKLAAGHPQSRSLEPLPWTFEPAEERSVSVTPDAESNHP